MIQALQIALKISCQYYTIDILPYVDNCVCELSKLNGFPFNICFESKAFNCNSLGLLEFVVVVYKAWLWNLYFYSRQHQFADDDDDDEKERKRRTEDKVLVTFQLVAKVFHLWAVLRMIFCRECSFENDLLQRMMFCLVWWFENDLLQVSEPRADIQWGRKEVEHERVSQEERTRGHQVLNYG